MQAGCGGPAGVRPCQPFRLPSQLSPQCGVQLYQALLQQGGMDSVRAIKERLSSSCQGPIICRVCSS